MSLLCFLGSHQSDIFKFKAYDQTGDTVVVEACDHCAPDVYPEQKAAGDD